MKRGRTNNFTKALRHLHDTAELWVMPLSRETIRGHPEMNIHTTRKLARANLPTITDEDDGADRAMRLHAIALAFHVALGINKDLYEKHASEIQSCKAAHPKSPLLLSILTGELWDIQTLTKAGLYHSNQCLLCGNAIGTFEHTTWHYRVRNLDPLIKGLHITPEALPDIIKNRGWTPSMTADPCQSF